MEAHAEHERQPPAQQPLRYLKRLHPICCGKRMHHNGTNKRHVVYWACVICGRTTATVDRIV
jgi:hypothetical protein